MKKAFSVVFGGGGGSKVHSLAFSKWNGLLDLIGADRRDEAYLISSRAQIGFW